MITPPLLRCILLKADRYNLHPVRVPFIEQLIGFPASVISMYPTAFQWTLLEIIFILEFFWQPRYVALYHLLMPFFSVAEYS
jgi:hypothetical protein